MTQSSAALTDEKQFPKHLLFLFLHVLGNITSLNFHIVVTLSPTLSVVSVMHITDFAL